MSPIPFILGQLDSTRAYTLAVLEHTPRELWLRSPPQVSTHVLWHLGHLAFAQYSHFVMLIMGETTADVEVFPKERYLTLFAKGTVPDTTLQVYPAIDEVLADLAGLHAHVCARFAEFPAVDLERPTLRPHPLAKTRFDMAMWWIKHEGIHTGQIALLRRMLGCAPWR